MQWERHLTTNIVQMTARGRGTACPFAVPQGTTIGRVGVALRQPWVPKLVLDLRGQGFYNYGTLKATSVSAMNEIGAPSGPT